MITQADLERRRPGAGLGRSRPALTTPSYAESGPSSSPAPDRPDPGRARPPGGEAFDRLSREYPSTRDGLSLTERRILAATPEEGTSAAAVFAPLGDRDAQPYLADLFLFRSVAGLARAWGPLRLDGRR